MIVFWTDGSASPNPGPGGFAVIEVRDNVGKPVILGKEEKSSNIRMEGLAITAAIKRANGEPCEIHTDSEFWVNVLTKWAPAWKKNEWHKADEKKFSSSGEFIGWKETKIKNLDIVQTLYELYEKNPVELVWTRGHVGTKFNEMADEWANRAREGAKLSEM